MRRAQITAKGPKNPEAGLNRSEMKRLTKDATVAATIAKRPELRAKAESK
jgi:hypothetical protein